MTSMLKPEISMKFDVLALGELLIDFTPVGKAASGGAVFEQNPGGAPANVLAALARLGGRAAFIGKVGRDQFGNFLRDVLIANGIDAQGLRYTAKASTTLAFVHLDSSGNRSFSFCRKPGADILLEAREVDLTLLEQCSVFHFGSLSLTNEPARSATLHAAKQAKRLGKIISYDPNWRPPLWRNAAAAKKGMELGLVYCDVIKVSETELEFLTGEPDIPRAASRLADIGIQTVLVTLGADGCYFKCRAGAGHVPSYPVKAVDTTGAGDAFLGAFLFRLCRSGKSPDELLEDEMIDMVRFANAVGALCTTRKGAISAMPEPEEVEALMKSGC